MFKVTVYTLHSFLYDTQLKAAEKRQRPHPPFSMLRRGERFVASARKEKEEERREEGRGRIRLVGGWVQPFSCKAM